MASNAQNLQSGEQLPIVGEGFKLSTQKALQHKQALIANKGIHSNQYFNNNPPWIKLASSVKVLENNNDSSGGAGIVKLSNAGLPESFKGTKLAENFVLAADMGGDSKKNSGFLGFGGKGFFNSAYGFGDTKFGFRPLPGIVDMTVETLGDNGSMRKATINIKAFNQIQFNIIELLYMRLGYHVLVEWGRTRYVTDSGSKTKLTGNTLVDSEWFDEDNFPPIDLGSLASNLANQAVTVQEEIAILESQEVVLEAEIEQLQPSFFNVPSGFGRQSSAYATTTTQLAELRADIEKYEDQLDDINEFISEEFNNYYGQLLKKITGYRNKYNKDYDGMIGRVTNFKWDLDKNGVYDITIDVMSAGDVLQSLIVNGNEAPVGPNELAITKNGSNPLHVLKDGGDIVRVLNNLATFCRGYTLPQEAGVTGYYQSGNHYAIEGGEDLLEEQFQLGGFSERFTEGSLVGDWNPDTINLSDDVTEVSTAEFLILREEYGTRKGNYTNGFIHKNRKYDPTIFLNSLDVISDIIGTDKLKDLVADPFDDNTDEHHSDEFGTFIDSANNIYEIIKVKSKGAGAAVNSFYISLHYYLTILQEICVPRTKFDSKPSPIIRILNERGKYLCNTHPLQISAQPAHCLLSKKIDIGPYLDTADGNLAIDPNASTQLDIFQNNGFYQFETEVDGKKYGDIMNIYLNMEWLADLLTNDGDTDEFGNLKFINHIGKVVKGINIALGSMNHIDFRIDEQTNTAYFFDRTALQNLNGLLDFKGKETTPFLFNVLGFKSDTSLGGRGIGSIVRDFNLNTTISPELSTMVTVGGNQSGPIAGYDMTAFSTWNKGLQDRVYPERWLESFTNNSTILNTARINALLVDYLNSAKLGYKIEVFDEKDVYEDLYSGIGESALADTAFGRGWNRAMKGLQLASRTYIVDYDTNAISGINTSAFGALISILKTVLYTLYGEKYKETNIPTPISGFIPLDLQLTFHGTSDIGIFQSYTIPSRFLPRTYPTAMRFICKKLTDTISEKGWTTKLNSFSIPDATIDDSSYLSSFKDYNSWSGTSTSESPITQETTEYVQRRQVSSGTGGGGSSSSSGISYTVTPFTGSIPSSGGFVENMKDFGTNRKDLWHDYVSKMAVELRSGTRYLSCATHVFSYLYYVIYFYYGPGSTQPSNIKLSAEEVNNIMYPWKSSEDFKKQHPGEPSDGYPYAYCYSAVWKYYLEGLPYINDRSKIQPMDIGFSHGSGIWRPGHIFVISEKTNASAGIFKIYDQHSGCYPNYGAFFSGDSEGQGSISTGRQGPDAPGTTNMRSFRGFYRLTDSWAIARFIQGGIDQSRAEKLIGSQFTALTIPNVEGAPQTEFGQEGIKEEYKFDKFTRKQRNWGILYFYMQRNLNKDYRDLAKRIGSGEGVFSTTKTQEAWEAYIKSSPSFNPTKWPIPVANWNPLFGGRFTDAFKKYNNYPK